MSDTHANMVAALRRVLTPALRNRGFRGTFPHFRRTSGQQLDLLTAQFSRWGGEFVVEVARCPVGGVTMPWSAYIAPAKVNAHHVVERRRLGATGAAADHWFRFESASTDAAYDGVAAAVLPLLDSQAEPYWRAA